jgi:hypothetical protein
MSDGSTELAEEGTPVPSEAPLLATDAQRADVVPAWLLALVAVLLLAVIGTGGYLIRERMSRTEERGVASVA